MNITSNYLLIRITAILLLISFSLMPLAADDTTTNYVALSPDETYTGTEDVVVKLADLEGEESVHYAFLYGYQAMAENKCNAALLTFDGDDNYITGYLTENAPDDFCTRLSANTIAVSEPVTSETMYAMYQFLGDRSSLSILMAREDKAYIAVILFEPNDDMEVTPMWYAEIENRISNEANARGINPNDVYYYQELNGNDKDSLIALVASGDLTISTVVADAVQYKKATTESNETILSRLGITQDSLFEVIVLGGFIILLIIFLILVTKLFTQNKETIVDDEDDDKEEGESEESSDDSEETPDNTSDKE